MKLDVGALSFAYVLRDACVFQSPWSCVYWLALQGCCMTLLQSKLSQAYPPLHVFLVKYHLPASELAVPVYRKVVEFAINSSDVYHDNL